jgi:hypothetical protein
MGAEIAAAGAVIADAKTADEMRRAVDGVLARFRHIYVLGVSLEARSAGS